MVRSAGGVGLPGQQAARRFVSVLREDEDGNGDQDAPGLPLVVASFAILDSSCCCCGYRLAAAAACNNNNNNKKNKQ
jgi:hypothetical protein